jgi:hypothetical protein
VEYLPAYAHDLDPVEGLWASPKGVELANLARDTIAEVLAATSKASPESVGNPHCCSHFSGTAASISEIAVNLFCEALQSRRVSVQMRGLHITQSAWSRSMMASRPMTRASHAPRPNAGCDQPVNDIKPPAVAIAKITADRTERRPCRGAVGLPSRCFA